MGASEIAKALKIGRAAVWFQGSTCRRGLDNDEDGGVVRNCYGAMELGRIRAREIAKTPSSVTATSPKFQRVRWVDSIEVVRELMEGDSLVPRPGPGAQVLRDSSGCKANGGPPPNCRGSRGGYRVRSRQFGAVHRLDGFVEPRPSLDQIAARRFEAGPEIADQVERRSPV